MIRTAIAVSKAEQLAIGIPKPGIYNEKVLNVIVDPEPSIISVMKNNFFFSFELLYFFS